MARARIIDTTEKKALYNKWLYVKARQHSDEFDSFSGFCAWAASEGYMDGGRLLKKDKDAPFSPWNCCFSYGEEIEPEWAKEWSERWITTVNCIRKLCGLPQLEGGENHDKPNL